MDGRFASLLPFHQISDCCFDEEERCSEQREYARGIQSWRAPVCSLDIYSHSKPKNARSKRVLEKREAKLVENPKTAIFVRGNQSSEKVNLALTELAALKKPDAISFSKKNDIHPFESTTSLEFFSAKNDASLFVVGHSQKKRPDNLVWARMFDGQVLDMIEVGITQATSMKEFKVSGQDWIVQRGEFSNDGEAERGRPRDSGLAMAVLLTHSQVTDQPLLTATLISRLCSSHACSFRPPSRASACDRASTFPAHCSTTTLLMHNSRACFWTFTGARRSTASLLRVFNMSSL